ncbi:dipeptidyl aminopeptidase/acylaminoacyl peptidase [Leeuwenhoekiella aestuarii]|uniref:Dipeptidyl aminopeptidase/acylaminoacyl peptidase n=1 Tax=Leeuwenhoekiella aestuarii TaxID=2249426 RepID=A0A4Q0NWP1_9FLAO|nr:alpha/beta fold hydrolase [Leeuwenhoekiella aestuarii]RXG15953.1 dipeptidyl aminopeptidase/acylaminoacyl peptidase [Leeuwenhoekiella aestuarii]RXG16647.1 dipeptidyl aminopeptidase/acylaminoacyl peptidase [Leeuwenhoekiella aestuarii]
MRNYITSIVVLLVFQTTLLAQDNIVAYGIPDNVFKKEYAEINKYRSQINFPPFIGWSLDSKKMLFNGGKSMYAMKNYKSEIKEYKKSSQNFSSHLSPNHKYFLYQEDENGDEEYQLFVYDIAKNTNKALSKKGDKTYDPFWSSDNSKIAYKSNKEKAARVDLYVRDISKENKAELVFKDFSDDGQIYDWSSDKELILAVKVISENDKVLYLINDNSYAIEQLNSGNTEVAYSDAKFIPNRNACFIVSDEFSEFLQLHYYDLATREFTTITTNIHWDVEAITIDKQGQKAAFSTNENGLSQLYILDIPTLKYTKVNEVPNGIISDLTMNPKGTEVGFNFYSSTFSRKIYGYTIKENRLNQYTRKGKPQTDSIVFVKAEPFTFKSIDTKTNNEYKIPAYIYKSKKESSPVFIDIHGGPEYQARASFNGFYQYLVNELGVTVIVPNIRGSNGYGKTYMKMDDGLNREHAIQDIGGLLKWIKLQDYLDENRVAIHGESYGGYVVLASLAKFPNAIKCGIDIVGISNWITYLNNTSAYRRDLRRVEFGDERNTEMNTYLKKISPVNQVNDIKSPLLIFQGLHDPRVDYREAEQMYESINKQEKEVWYVLAKDEGHGFHKYKNYLLQKNLTISFLKKHLSIE